MLKKNNGVEVGFRPKCYTALWFFIPIPIYCLVIRQITQSIQWKPTEQAASKNIRKYLDVRKVGPFIYESRKIECHVLCWKKELIVNWQRWKRGGIQTHIRTMPYIGSNPSPSTPSHTHTYTHTAPSLFPTHENYLKRNTCGDWQKTIMHCVNTVSEADCRCYFKHVGYLIIKRPMC